MHDGECLIVKGELLKRPVFPIPFFLSCLSARSVSYGSAVVDLGLREGEKRQAKMADRKHQDGSDVDIPSSAMAEAILSHRHRRQSHGSQIQHEENGRPILTSRSRSRSSKHSKLGEKETTILETEGVGRPSTSTLDSTDMKDQTHRRLRPRHIQLIGIGGTIGTALFVSIGRGLMRGGPANLFLAFTIW